MSEFTFHEKSNAPEKAKPLLEKAEQGFGFIPNILKGMAEAPGLLEGYMTLSGLFEQTELSPTEQQVVLMAASHENQCHYCMTAHTAIAKQSGVADEVIDALRNNTEISDSKLEALRRFTRAVVDKRGHLAESDLQALFDAGYSKRTALEVMLGVGMKTLSNYTNHILETPVDEELKPMAWSPGRQAAE